MSNFKTNDLVLARRDNKCNMSEIWLCYTFIGEDGEHYYFTDGLPHNKDKWEIIPFKGNESLLGKTCNVPKPYVPNVGELCAMRNSLDEEWISAVFQGMTCNNRYEGKIFVGFNKSFNYCEPLKNHFTFRT